MARKGWRFIASRLNGDGTDDIFSYDVPLSDASITRKLSGPDELSGKLTPEIGRMQDDDGEPLFDPWSTCIYAEKDGVIRAACIVNDVKEEGPDLSLECVGFAGYTKDMPYKRELSKIGVDPLDMFRHIWKHTQSFHNADLGLRIDDTESDVTIGTEEKDDDEASGEGEEEDGPYTLTWWDNHDLQDDMDKLASDTPFDYEEVHKWSSGRSLRVRDASQLAMLDIDPGRVMQSFVRDNYSGDYYVSQVRGASGNDDTHIYHCDSDGNVQSESFLMGAGHGSTIEKERDDDGNFYIVTYWAKVHKMARWKYTGGRNVEPDDDDVELLWRPPEAKDTYYNLAIDHDDDRVAVRHHDGYRERFYLRKYSEYKNGEGDVLSSMSTDRHFFGAFQGFALTGSYLYVNMGGTHGGAPARLARLDMDSGTILHLDVSRFSPRSSLGTKKESEGVDIYNGKVLIGKATGLKHARDASVWQLDGLVEHDGDVVDHRLRLATPKIGKRRHDLRFVAGENVVEVPELDYDGDDYASGVVVLGAGEGRDMIRGQAYHETRRMRRVAVVEDKSLKKKADATKAAQRELKLRVGKPDLAELKVRDHKHAPTGSINLGDEIAYRTPVGWSSPRTIWARVLEIEYAADSADVTLTVRRGDKVDSSND